jgi:O-6-methylguanine DNA methyltransferase
MRHKDFSLPHLQKKLRSIPKGKVVTYAELAKALGNPKASRAAGTLCGKNPEPNTYPCFKVVRSDGSIGQFAYGTEDKIRRLQKEGIDVKNGKVVDFQKRKYTF